MHRYRALPRVSSSGILAALAWLLASLATAALSHVLIGVLSVGGDAYDDHAHTALIPVGFGAVGLIAALLLRSVVIGLGRSHAVDPALVLARRFGRMRPLVPVAAVVAGGLATLLAMEFVEQWTALGHIEGVADALGGNILAGASIVASLAAALTVAGLRSAGALLRATIATANALWTWIRAEMRALGAGPMLCAAQPPRRCGAQSAFFAHAHGLRAPPVPAA